MHFCLTRLHWSRSLRGGGVILEFCQGLWCKKTRFLRLLPCRVDSVMTVLAVLIELGLVADGQTDGRSAIAYVALAEHREGKMHIGPNVNNIYSK